MHPGISAAGTHHPPFFSGQFMDSRFQLSLNGKNAVLPLKAMVPAAIVFYDQSYLI
jgi:hypothetical protein